MPDLPFNNDATQAERRRILENDRLNTYQAHAAASVDEERGGRFSVRTKPTVVGQSPISYPKQPEGSPWACDPLPIEPPLGVDINAMEVTGEPHERTELAPTDPAPVSVRLRRRI
jgi:hypothetical protein